MTERIVWITGAGKGIGRALALELARGGDRIAASARTEKDLDSLVAEAAAFGGDVRAFPLDIADDRACEASVARIEKEMGAIGLAVLNAGTHAEISSLGFDLETFSRVVGTNLVGTANCLAALLPRLVSRGSGHLAFVSSLAARPGLPTAGAYAASKAGLTALWEAMTPELESAGIASTLVEPGFVDTPLTRLNTFAMPFLMEPEQAARIIARGLARKKTRIAFPWQMAVAIGLLRLLPHRLLFAITRTMVRTPRT
ncbi:MAG: SDR family NAD(P)-dependent oxidoreductase [Alphaproteobacteria bacterium]|nr:SDR family NAD(P)-dependent oxidoreductase [Alphaproteobacteria bacterium]